ncbi:MAG: hypothetical protein WBH85_12400 [Thermoanaerobaculia bacterium]
MSENETPPTPPEPPTPTEPPAPPSSPPPGKPDSNRAIMIVLSYLWVLALVPLLLEKDDSEVQWHAKNGLVLFAAELILWVGLAVLGMVPVLGCILVPVWLALSVAVIVVHIICIVKGLNGERFLVPGISQYADRF